MRLISREDLKAKLDRGENFVLVMALGGWAFRAKHIPGSVSFDNPEEGLKTLQKDAEIVVYCSDPACIASMYAYKFLVEHGYTNVCRYAGGLSQWEDAGYPLEGEMVNK